MQFYCIVNTTLLEVGFEAFEEADKTFYQLDNECGVCTIGHVNVAMTFKDAFKMAEEGVFLKEKEEIIPILEEYARTATVASLEVN